MSVEGKNFLLWYKTIIKSFLVVELLQSASYRVSRVKVLKMKV